MKKRDNLKNDILNFIKNYLTFKPTFFQEQLLKYCYDKNKLLWYNRKNFKTFLNNEFTCNAMLSMKKGEKFGLAHPKGLFIFELKEIKK